MAKIDAFSHILPRKYFDALCKKASGFHDREMIEAMPALWNLEARFRIMDKYDGLTQLLVPALPPLEAVADAQTAAELAQIANEAVAEMVAKYPDRFVAGVAFLPMNNIDAALRETDRAIKELKLKGVMVYTNVNGKPLDSAEFMPLYEKMAGYDLPIWIHPRKDKTVPDYPGESGSKYVVWGSLAWPYETSVAMTRLVCSGVLDKHPNIKFVTHHCGGVVPMLAGRVDTWFRPSPDPERDAYMKGFSKAPREYFPMFYADTAVNGSTPALMCGFAYFGTEHILFGTDMPFCAEGGEEFVRMTIRNVNEMCIANADRKKIFEGNVRRLLKLPG